MRIEKIAIENINSLAGRFEVDLRDPGYADGLFAIVGPSGSGKTTVLDAIALALYGRTPRIGKPSESQNEVMSRGADMCRAEAQFAARGKRYKATFVHKRAKGKNPFGQVQREVMIREDDGTWRIIASKIRDADIEVARITGLDYDQFTRSIMLAQFQFAEFLKADATARADILEQITDMDIYRRISMAVFERKKGEDEKLSKIRAQQDVIRVLPDDEEKKLAAEQAQIEKKAESYAALQGQFAFCRDTLGGIEKLHRDTVAYEKEKAAAADALTQETARFGQAKKDEDAVIAAQSALQQTLKEVRALDQSLSAADKETAGIKSDIDALNKDIIGRMNDAKAIFEKHMPDVTRERMRVLFESDDVAGIIRAQADADLKQAQQKQAAQQKTMQATLLGKTEAHYTQRAELLDGALPVVRAQRAIVVAEVARDTQQRSIAQLQKDAAAQKIEQKQIDEKFLMARLLAQYGEERKRLVDGQPCPLCGATEHPGVHAAQDDEYLAAITTQRDDLQKQALQTQNEIAVAQRSIQTLEKTMDEQRDILKASKDALMQRGWSLGDVGIDLVDDMAEQKIKAERDDIAQRLRTYRTQRVEYDEIGREVLECTARLGDVNTDAQRVQHAHQAVDDAKQRIAARQKTLQQAQDEHTRLADRRAALFGQDDPDNAERKASGAVQKARAASDTARDTLEKAKSRADQAQKDIARTAKETAAMQAALDTAYAQAAQDAKAAFGGEADAPQAIVQAVQALTPTASDSVDAIQRIASALQALIARQRERKGELKSTLDQNAQHKARLKELVRQEKVQAAASKKWESLNKLIGSADGSKFSRMAQGITFEVLLQYANASLSRMSDRYILVRDTSRRDKPLEISVIDTYQAGDIRPVSNLSGGESFVVSMALALGLSEMSSNKTRIDSLFIDEGFASLDENYLEAAMQTLSALGNRDGKLVGVISHVDAVKERIGAKIEVSPLSGGRSTLMGPGVRVAGE